MNQIKYTQQLVDEFAQINTTSSSQSPSYSSSSHQCSDSIDKIYHTLRFPGFKSSQWNVNENIKEPYIDTQDIVIIADSEFRVINDSFQCLQEFTMLLIPRSSQFMQDYLKNNTSSQQQASSQQQQQSQQPKQTLVKMIYDFITTGYKQQSSSSSSNNNSSSSSLNQPSSSSKFNSNYTQITQNETPILSQFLNNEALRNSDLLEFYEYEFGDNKKDFAYHFSAIWSQLQMKSKQQKMVVLTNRSVGNLVNNQELFAIQLINSLYDNVIAKQKQLLSNSSSSYQATIQQQQRLKVCMMFYNSPFDQSIWLYLIKDYQDNNNEQQQPSSNLNQFNPNSTENLKLKLFALFKGVPGLYKPICLMRYIALINQFRQYTTTQEHAYYFASNAKTIPVKDFDQMLDSRELNNIYNYRKLKKVLVEIREQTPQNEIQDAMLISNHHNAFTDVLMAFLVALRSRLIRWLFLESNKDFKYLSYYEQLLFTQRVSKLYLNPFNSYTLYGGTYQQAVLFESMHRQNKYQIANQTDYNNEQSASEMEVTQLNRSMNILATNWADLVWTYNQFYNWNTYMSQSSSYATEETVSFSDQQSSMDRNTVGQLPQDLTQFIDSIQAVTMSQVYQLVRELYRQIGALSSHTQYQLSTAHGMVVGLKTRLLQWNVTLSWLTSQIHSIFEQQSSSSSNSAEIYWEQLLVDLRESRQDFLNECTEQYVKFYNNLI